LPRVCAAAKSMIVQIAAEVGMSGRSVSRYFASKEDMVVGNLRLIGQGIADRLAGRPQDEPPWEAIRRALDEHLDKLNSDPGGTLLATSVMLASTPTLRAALANKHKEWEDLLVPLVASRLTTPRSSVSCRPAHSSRPRWLAFPPRSPNGPAAAAPSASTCWSIRR